MKNAIRSKNIIIAVLAVLLVAALILASTSFNYKKQAEQAIAEYEPIVNEVMAANIELTNQANEANTAKAELERQVAVLTAQVEALTPYVPEIDPIEANKMFRKKH